MPSPSWSAGSQAKGGGLGLPWKPLAKALVADFPWFPIPTSKMVHIKEPTQLSSLEKEFEILNNFY